MARFRPAPEAEALLAAVAGVEPDDEQHLDPVDAVRDWLAVQRVGRISLTEPGGPLLDVHDPDLLRDLDKHPLIRAALEDSGLGTPLNPARLDEGIIRLGGPLGRPVTQALSRAVREWLPDIAGLAYRSRLDDEEWCWARRDDTDIDIRIDSLHPGHRHHRRAVQHAARLLQIHIPAQWQQRSSESGSARFAIHDARPRRTCQPQRRHATRRTNRSPPDATSPTVTDQDRSTAEYVASMTPSDQPSSLSFWDSRPFSAGTCQKMPGT